MSFGNELSRLPQAFQYRFMQNLRSGINAEKGCLDFWQNLKAALHAVATCDLLSPWCPAPTWHCSTKCHCCKRDPHLGGRGLSLASCTPALILSKLAWEATEKQWPRGSGRSYTSLFFPTAGWHHQSGGGEHFVHLGVLESEREKRGARNEMPCPYGDQKGAGDKSQVLLPHLVPYHPSWRKVPHRDKTGRRRGQREGGGSAGKKSLCHTQFTGPTLKRVNTIMLLVIPGNVFLLSRYVRFKWYYPWLARKITEASWAQVTFMLQHSSSKQHISLC